LINLKVGLEGEEMNFLVNTRTTRSSLMCQPKGTELSKERLTVLGVKEEEIQVLISKKMLLIWG
jgi:hypothetical protein